MYDDIRNMKYDVLIGQFLLPCFNWLYFVTKNRILIKPPRKTKNPSFISVSMKNNQLPNPKLQEDFDVSRYLGDWYELYRSKNICFEKGSDIVARYGSDPEHPDRMTVTNLQTLDDGKISTITGYAVRKSAEAPASDLVVRFNWFLRGRYKIIRTDYDAYSIVYSSRKILFGLLKKEYCWILARKRDAINDTALIDGLFATIEEETGMVREEFIISRVSSDKPESSLTNE